jgi:Flp pilus assembly protein TadB
MILIDPTYIAPLFNASAGPVILLIAVVVLVSGALVIKKVMSLRGPRAAR